MTRRFPEEYWINSATRELPTPTETVDDRAARTNFTVGGTNAALSNQAQRLQARAQFLQQPGKLRALYVPRNYEENYAYPLIVWLHGNGGSEQDLLQVMPQISTRNYIAIAFRGNGPTTTGFPVGYRWSQTDEGIERFAAELHEAVCQLRKVFHIHSERIYLAGRGDGASTALTLLLKQPDWFGGGVILDGRLRRGALPLSRYRHLTGKRLLLAAATSTGSTRGVTDLNTTGRLLFSAGMDVSTATFDNLDGYSRMLRHIDHWIMEGIQAEG